jgi:SAM-dependent methyltransferase
VASVQQPGSDVPIRYIDVSRTGLQDRFFHNFEFDTADELLAALAGMEIDLATMARSHDLRREVYSGWVYWLLYLKGYIQYTKSGKVGSGNLYFDYLTKFYVGRGPDHGLGQELSEPRKVAERVARRFRDIDLFRKHPVEGPSSWMNKVAPVRIIVSDPPPENPLLIYEVGSDSPLKARLFDGWHRLCPARLFGIRELPCIVDQENRQLDHVRGTIEEFRFDGRRLVVRGWCTTKVDRGIIDAVEVRAGHRTIGRGSITNRSGANFPFGMSLQLERLDFQIDCECHLPTNEFIRFDILLLEEWLPRCAMVACYLPGMFNDREWPPAPLMRRLENENETRKLAIRSVKGVYEMLMPLQRHRALNSFTCILDWGSGCGLLEVFRLHFLPNSTLVGIDVDEEAIGWCRQSGLPGEFKVVDRMPPTDLAPDYFDLVLSYSALTHLTRDGQGAWLSEMHRVMKSGGYLVVGVYGELLRPVLTSPEILSELTSNGISDSTHNSRLESVDKAEQEHATYQTNAFTLREYSKWFEVVEYIEGGLNDLLDLVIMRKA